MPEGEDMEQEWTATEIEALRREILRVNASAARPTPPPRHDSDADASLRPRSSIRQNKGRASAASVALPSQSHLVAVAAVANGDVGATVSTAAVTTAAEAPRLPPVRTHSGFSGRHETDAVREKRLRWQRIAKASSTAGFGYGRNYLECRWIWRKLKHAQSVSNATAATELVTQLSKEVPQRREAATQARRDVYTTGGGNADYPWTEAQLQQLEELAKEHNPKRYRGDKRARWKAIQQLIGLPDRSYKSCQRAFRKVQALQQASQRALDEFDQARRALAHAKEVAAEAARYVTKCKTKERAASQRITFQRHLDRQLRLTAHASVDEHDLDGRPRALASLLQRGADPNAADAGGFTALMAAAMKNACGAIECLLDNGGADIDRVDSDGRSALEHAVEGGAAQAVQLLIRRGAVFHRSPDGEEEQEQAAKAQEKERENEEEEEENDEKNENGANKKADHNRRQAKAPDEMRLWAGAAPGKWGNIIDKELQGFLSAERRGFKRAEADRKWFAEFEARYSDQRMRKGGRKNRTRRRRTEEEPRNGQQPEHQERWPPALPPGSSHRHGRPPRSRDNRGSWVSRGGVSAGSGDSYVLPASRSSTASIDGSWGGHDGSSKGMQLKPPTALDALRLGLEGSSQRKKRLAREDAERERQARLAEERRLRPPTHERRMDSSRRRLGEAVADGLHVSAATRANLRKQRELHLHRAHTAGR